MTWVYRRPFNYSGPPESLVFSAGGPSSIIASSGSFSLTGQAALFQYRSLDANGSYSLTGEPALFRPSIVASNGSFALTGEPALFSVLALITAARGLYTLTGEPATLVPPPPEVGSSISGGTFSRGRWHKFVGEREAKAEAKRRAVKSAKDREARRARLKAEAEAKARQEQIAARAAAGDLALRHMQAQHSSEALHRLFGLHQLRAHQALLQAHASAHQEADDEEALALLAHLTEE